MSAPSKKTFNPDYNKPVRIINAETELVSVERLRNHPENARKGDIAEIAESIRENGFYGYLIVQKSTGYILAGNHTFLAGVHEGMHQFPVQWLDVTPEEALRILAVDNATSDKATYIEEKQAALLSRLALLNEERGLKGSGYKPQYLEHLKAKLANMKGPSTDSDGGSSKKGEGNDRYAIILICGDPGEQASLIGELESMGLKPKGTILNERTKIALG